MIEYESFAGIAQSVEQLIRNQQVVCSSHITSSIWNARPIGQVDQSGGRFYVGNVDNYLDFFELQ